jgi:SAM-dependent MidA family methyltransferase
MDKKTLMEGSPHLSAVIRAEIEKTGQISFSRFMQLALYHPSLGYYASAGEERKIVGGKGGDFMTSVSAGKMFARLIARQVECWWKAEGGPESYDFLEFGAHTGQFASDFLSSTVDPGLRRAMAYRIFEPQERLESCQRQTLSHPSLSDLPNPPTWIHDFGDNQRFHGTLFGNELLDALPFDILEHDPKTGDWLEVTVKASNQTGFEWGRAKASLEQIELLPPGIEGGRVEVPLAMIELLGKLSNLMEAGRMIWIDYGCTDEEYTEIIRPLGTARGYRGHQRIDDILTTPGEIDITAHVRWSLVIQTLENLGWKVSEFIQQGRWLTRIFAEEQLQSGPVRAPSSEEVRQFQMLTRPETFGDVFRVLIAEKPGWPRS